jgi:hypothetical protein
MLPFKTQNKKQKPRRFSLICFPLAHRENGSLSFVRLLTKKETEVSPLAHELNGLNGLAHLWCKVPVDEVARESLPLVEDPIAVLHPLPQQDLS